MLNKYIILWYYIEYSVENEIFHFLGPRSHPDETIDILAAGCINYKWSIKPCDNVVLW